MNVDSRIIDRIKKLLAIANDSRGNEHECANAAAMATKLMQKYNLDNADFIMEDLDKNGSIIGEDLAEPNYDKKIPIWYNVLGTAVGQVFECHCRVLKVLVDGKIKVTFKLFGYHTDVQVAKWLFAYLTVQINKLAEEQWKTRGEAIKRTHGRAPYASERTRFKNSYRSGLVNGILNKIQEVYGKIKDEEAGDVSPAQLTNALVVMKKRETIANEFGDFSYDKSKPNVDAEGFVDGLKDSNKIHVNRVINDNSCVAELEYVNA